MSNKKYKDTYVSDFYNVNEVIEILKKCPADIYFKLYHKIRKELVLSGGEPVKNPTLNNRMNQVENVLATLTTTVVSLSQRVGQIETTLKQVVTMMNEGFKRMDAGFKQVNNRIDKIDARLDYIVKANNLKDISN